MAKIMSEIDILPATGDVLKYISNVFPGGAGGCSFRICKVDIRKKLALIDVDRRDF